MLHKLHFYYFNCIMIYFFVILLDACADRISDCLRCSTIETACLECTAGFKLEDKRCKCESFIFHLMTHSVNHVICCSYFFLFISFVFSKKNPHFFPLPPPPPPPQICSFHLFFNLFPFSFPIQLFLPTFLPYLFFIARGLQ